MVVEEAETKSEKIDLNKEEKESQETEAEVEAKADDSSEDEVINVKKDTK